MTKYEDNIVGWFTQNGAHIPIHDGETQTEASRKFFESKRSVTEANETKKNWELKRREEERKKVEGLHRSSGDERFDKLAEKSKEEAVSRRLREEQELREAQEYLKAKYANIKGDEVKDQSEFAKSVVDAKGTLDPAIAWRVTAHTPEEYKELGAKMYTIGKSTVAVTKDGDIISVCKSIDGSGNGGGKELLALAVNNGGTKLDAFAGIHGFYCSQGFQPVSWTGFDKNYAPEGWKGHGAEEPVIFYKYVGKGNVNPADFSENAFTTRVKASVDYDTAKEIRDKSMKKK